MLLVPNLLGFVVYLNSELLISPSTSSLAAYRSVWITFQSIVLSSDIHMLFVLLFPFLNVCYFLLTIELAFKEIAFKQKIPGSVLLLYVVCNLLELLSVTNGNSYFYASHHFAKAWAGHAYFWLYILKRFLRLSSPISLTVAIEQIKFKRTELIVVTFAL